MVHRQDVLDPVAPRLQLGTTLVHQRPQPLPAGAVAALLERIRQLEQPPVHALERRRAREVVAFLGLGAQAASSRSDAAFCMRSLSRDIARVCTCETRDSEIPSVRPISLSVRCS